VVYLGGEDHSERRNENTATGVIVVSTLRLSAWSSYASQCLYRRYGGVGGGFFSLLIIRPTDSQTHRLTDSQINRPMLSGVMIFTAAVGQQWE